MNKNENEVEPYYQKRAESIVDMLFDAKLFIDTLTRKDLQAIENFIAFEFDSGVNNALKLQKIMALHNKPTSTNKEQDNA